MERNVYDAYVNLLERELVPATLRNPDTDLGIFFKEFTVSPWAMNYNQKRAVN